MRLCLRAGLVLWLLQYCRAQPALPQILTRVAEEAESFQQNAPKALTRETLEQRALLPSSRFVPRTGSGAPQPQARLQIREVVSEYSVGTLGKSSSGNLMELREVVAVDGRPIQSEESARHALSLGVHSADDRLRKRMLEDFAGHGLVDVATEYALILLAFTRRGQTQMHFEMAGEDAIATDPVLVLAWNQTSASEGELEFHGRQVTRRALQGTLWVRRSDGLPLRVQAWAEHSDKSHAIRDQATVEYVMSRHGFLTPASVLHQHLVDGRLMTQNLYRLEPFKMFGADTEIQFTQVPDPATLPPPDRK